MGQHEQLDGCHQFFNTLEHPVRPYEGPMRDAWRQWGERLDLLANKPANVVTLRAA